MTDIQKYYNTHLIKENMDRVLEQATVDIYKNAEEWYIKANKIAYDFAIAYELNIIKVCGIISCLSPQKNWWHNIELTNEFLQSKGTNCRHTGRQLDKARGVYFCLEGDNLISDIEILLGGKKTQNFFRNLLEPSNPNYVTLDQHMVQLMTGSMNKKVVRGSQYEFMKKLFLEYSKENNMLPSYLQATLWLVWKSVKVRKNSILI